MEKFYTTTAIDYVNGAPHIGHAYEKILTDVIYRHFTQRCDNTYFLTGTDEHGIKIQKTSAQNGVSPKEFCDMNAQKFKDAWKALDVEYSQFIRTTDEQHEKVVQKIFKKLVEKGDIYKHAYEGLYCSGCEAFLSEKDLTEDGLCPDHLKKPEVVKEENYFFKLTKYKDAIIKHIKTHPDFIVPSFRANEVLNQLENIEDISVSRVNSNVSWGIPVLGDDSQVIYVWIDALSNYITAIGYDPDGSSEKFEKLWPANVQVIGKDILKFHSIYWLAILMALELPLPEHILAHGWITIDQTKMSKSLGNGIDPLEVIDQYSTDALRFSLVLGISAGNDIRYMPEKLEQASNFANKLWNAAKFVLMNLDGVEKLPKLDEIDIAKLAKEDKWIISKLNTLSKEVNENITNYDLGVATQKIYDFIWNEFCDWYIEIVKTRLYGDDKESKLMAQVTLNEVLMNSLKLLHPIMPFITEEIYLQLFNIDESIMISKFPQFDEKYNFKADEEEIEKLKEIIIGIRNLRASSNVHPSKKTELIFVTTKYEDLINQSEGFLLLVHTGSVYRGF